MVEVGQIDYEGLDRDDVPSEGFEAGAIRDLVPKDVMSRPRIRAELHFSSEFTDEDESERTYIVLLDYPDCMDNTVVRMENVPTWAGMRLFTKFVKGEFGATHDIEVVDLIEVLEERGELDETEVPDDA